MGEPAAVATGASDATRKEWAGEIIEITFRTDIPAARDKAAISPPHWKKGEDPSDAWSLTSTLGLPDAPYSKKAAVYLVKDGGGSKDVEVKVNVTKCVNVSGTGTLKGTIGSLEISGDCPLAEGEHVVGAQITEMPDSIQHFRGQINWGMEAPDFGSVAMTSTLVELFFILGRPLSAYTPGVWVEALRLVCLRGPVTGIEKQDGARVVANVTRYCHSVHGMRYDTVRGASSFGVGGLGGTFILTNYLSKASTTVNCYDQAAAVQTLSGAVGVAVGWIFLQPYGFINATNLVGIGTCNNPFFSSNGSAPLVGQNDPARTSFWNHAFNEQPPGPLNASYADGFIFDACAGPHAGTEHRDAYLTAAIDTTTTGYARAGFAPGNVDIMQPAVGVTGIS
jgi:hypothetical protein